MLPVLLSALADHVGVNVRGAIRGSVEEDLRVDSVGLIASCRLVLVFHFASILTLEVLSNSFAASQVHADAVLGAGDCVGTADDEVIVHGTKGRLPLDLDSWILCPCEVDILLPAGGFGRTGLVLPFEGCQSCSRNVDVSTDSPLTKFVPEVQVVCEGSMAHHPIVHVDRTAGAAIAHVCRANAAVQAHPILSHQLGQRCFSTHDLHGWSALVGDDLETMLGGPGIVDECPPFWGQVGTERLRRR
mmetsp:Transcript_86369/g.180780  ORF Transcript_86369/g.180780 Transcript_86369/m.180780 type:complete len:245 (-) Transcript_86369:565-1299(-)